VGLLVKSEPVKVVCAGRVPDGGARVQRPADLVEPTSGTRRARLIHALRGIDQDQDIGRERDTSRHRKNRAQETQGKDDKHSHAERTGRKDPRPRHRFPPRQQRTAERQHAQQRRAKEQNQPDGKEWKPLDCRAHGGPPSRVRRGATKPRRRAWETARAGSTRGQSQCTRNISARKTSAARSSNPGSNIIRASASARAVANDAGFTTSNFAGNHHARSVSRSTGSSALSDRPGWTTNVSRCADRRSGAALSPMVRVSFVDGPAPAPG